MRPTEQLPLPVCVGQLSGERGVFSKLPLNSTLTAEPLVEAATLVEPQRAFSSVSILVLFVLVVELYAIAAVELAVQGAPGRPVSS